MLRCRSVLILDDHPLFRQGMVQLLHQAPDMHVAAEAAGSTDSLNLALSLDPDLVLLDLAMRELSGLEALRAMRAARLRAKVVIVTASGLG